MPGSSARPAPASWRSRAARSPSSTAAAAGLWHATGHEGAGIGLAAGTAAVLRDLMLGRAPDIDAAPFRVARPAVREAA